MKRYIPFLFSAVLAMTLLASCKKDFLEEVPFGKATAQKTSDYALLMNNNRFYYYEYAGAGGWQEPMLMGDEIAAYSPIFTGAGTTQMLRLFQWQDSIYTVKDEQPNSLRNWLNDLYTLNKIINEVQESTGGTQQEKDQVRAEAMATRAWTNFQLINYYAKPYDPNTASKDLGFPIITTAVITNNDFPRGTVQEMYDFMIKDLETAITSLPVKPAIQTHFSKPSAEGILGKIYLFMGNHSGALRMFDAAFSDLAQSDFAKLYDYNQTLSDDGSFQPIDPDFGPNGPGNNYMDIYEAVVSKVFYSGAYQYNGYIGNDGVVLAPWAQALYSPSDLRLKLYSEYPQYEYDNPFPNGLIRKSGVQYSRWGLQLPELYLLRAEANARENHLPAAVSDVETLRQNRMPDFEVPSAAATNQTALIKFIIDERVREFAGEGMRWFDMRRLSVDPLFMNTTYTHLMFEEDGSTTSYTLRQPNRLTLQLPPTIINRNQNMPNNP